MRQRNEELVELPSARVGRKPDGALLVEDRKNGGQESPSANDQEER